VGLYDGSLKFVQTDVSLKGTGVPLAISREHRAGSFTTTADRLGTFADWDWDLPRVTTLVSALPGPQGSTSYGGQWQPTARCSQFSGQPVQTPPSPYELPFDLQLGDWWSGYQLITPEGSTQELLLRSPTNPLSPAMSGSGIPSSFPIVTTDHWMIGCLSQTSNGEAGEGFFAVSPNGTKYWLDRLVYEQADTLRYPQYRSGTVMRWPRVFRMRATMLVTRIEDRFGNWMTFGYADSSSKRLTSITTSDGRQVSMQWRSDAPYIHSITLQPQSSAARTWSYAYSNPTNTKSARLTSVTLPDGKQWTFDLNFVPATYYSDDGIYPTCRANTALAGEGLAATTGTVTHPSGLVGSFVLQNLRHGRSYTPRSCRNGGPNASLFRIPAVYMGFTVLSKRLTGPGVDHTWTYTYSAPNGSLDVDCVSTTCASTVTTAVTEPDGSGAVHTFSNRWGETEGKLLQTDILDASATVVRTESIAYAGSGTGPFPAQIGTLFASNLNADQITRLTPRSQSTVAENGDSYTWQALAFDRYGNAVQTRRFNSIPGQTAVQERVVYANDDAAFQGRWVLGQVKQVDNQTAGLTIHSMTYDSNAMPQARYAFGLKVMDYTWHSVGLPATFT
jgi:hypothetical protein